MQGTKAFEGLGGHVPTGMVRRLTLVAERKQNRIIEEDPENLQGIHLPETTSLERAEAHATLRRRRPGSKDSSRGCRQQRIEQQHPVDATNGGVAVVGDDANIGMINNGSSGQGTTEQDRYSVARRARGEQRGEEGCQERILETSRRGIGQATGDAER